MRTTFIKTVTKLARRNKNIMLLTGDLGFTLFEQFREEFPDQFTNVGVAEANMMGMAAGLALTGKTVFAYSIATFASMRPLEQIRNDIASHKAHVIVVGTGAGLSYGDASITHHALEDIALMRVIPGMTVLTPGDPFETEWATRMAAKLKGPAYLRLGKQKDPPLYLKIPKLKLGQGSILTTGEDILIIAVGNIVANTRGAVEILARKKIRATVVSQHTIKPVDRQFLHNLTRPFHSIVTVEEHQRNGGLGGAIAEELMDLHWKGRLLRLGIPDQFIYTIGSQQYLREIVGLTSEKIAASIARFIRRSARP